MGLIGVRLAPGVRVSLSGRGARAHVGPRALRVHTGAGRTGISTGAGPLTYYTAVGGSRPPRSLSPAPTAAQVEKAARAQQLEQELHALESRHEHRFVPMTRPTAQVLEPTLGLTRRERIRSARSGVPWYDLTGRRLAKRAGLEAAAADDRELTMRHERDRRNRQEELDAFWHRLTANEPATVMAFVQEAFEDNEDAAAIVGIAGDEAYLVVMAPDESTVPVQVPGVTPTGRPSIRKMPAKTAAAYHRQAVAGSILLTAQEALAVAPGLASVKVAALRDDVGPNLMWSVRLRRDRLAACGSAERSSVELLSCAADENEFRLHGAAGRLEALDPDTCGWTALISAFEDESPKTLEGR